MTAHKKRNLASMVSMALNNMPVVVITGMRQSGKTTFLQNQPGRGKWGTGWQERDLAGLKPFLSSTPHCKAAILGYNGRDAVQLGEKLWALPLNLILS